MKHSDAFVTGLVMASIVWVWVVVAAVMFSGRDPYDRCAPDEVWAWQMVYRADAENREWECVAISDLKEVGK